MWPCKMTGYRNVLKKFRCCWGSRKDQSYGKAAKFTKKSVDRRAVEIKGEKKEEN